MAEVIKDKTKDNKNASVVKDGVLYGNDNSSTKEIVLSEDLEGIREYAYSDIGIEIAHLKNTVKWAHHR